MAFSRDSGFFTKYIWLAYGIIKSDGVVSFFKKVINKGMKGKKYPSDYINSDIYYAALMLSSKRATQPNAVTGAVVKPLHTSFSSQSIRSHLLGDDWWMDFIIAASGLDEDTSEVQYRLIARINALDTDAFEDYELLHLYILALRVGLFELGYTLRCKASETAINKLSNSKKPKGKAFIRAMAALLEVGHYAEFQEMLHYLGSFYQSEKRLLNQLYQIFYPSEETQSKGKAGVLDEDEDQEFFELINGKSIAIVGPAQTDVPDAYSIDSHDIVVRMNYKEEGVGIDKNIKGLRCDITYFNKPQADYLYTQEEMNWPLDIIWAVCNDKGSVNKVKEKLNKISSSPSMNNDRDNINCKVRALQSVNSVIFYGKLNALPNVVLDLLRFSPRVIRVFHADLMLTVYRYTGYYPDEWLRDDHMKQLFIKSSLRIDPVIQYWLLNTLWKQGKIQGDTRFNEVMSLGVEEYMQQLQKIYGDAGRIKVADD